MEWCESDSEMVQARSEFGSNHDHVDSQVALHESIAHNHLHTVASHKTETKLSGHAAEETLVRCSVGDVEPRERLSLSVSLVSN